MSDSNSILPAGSPIVSVNTQSNQVIRPVQTARKGDPKNHSGKPKTNVASNPTPDPRFVGNAVQGRNASAKNTRPTGQTVTYVVKQDVVATPDPRLVGSKVQGSASRSQNAVDNGYPKHGRTPPKRGDKFKDGAGRKERESRKPKDRADRDGPRPNQSVSQKVAPQPENPKAVSQTPKTQRVEEPFHGSSLMKFSEKYAFGPEAEVLLRKKFSNLETAGRFEMSRVEKHHHPYAAWARKYADRMIHSGLTSRHLIDVGGHAVRTATTTRYREGVYTPCSQTIHSMLPRITGLDELRHSTWNRTLMMRPDISHDRRRLHHIINNACNVRAAANGAGLCTCLAANTLTLQNQAGLVYDVKSVDSIYYPGVLEGIETYLLANRESHAYIAFHDYKMAVDSGILEYVTPDRESTVQIIPSGHIYEVVSDVDGNSLPYRHAIWNTGNGRCWSRYEQHSDITIVYELIDSIPMGRHDYKVVVATTIDGKLDAIVPDNEPFLKPAPSRNNRVDIVSRATKAVFNLTGRVLKNIVNTAIDLSQITSNQILSTLRVQISNFLKENPKLGADRTSFEHIAEWLSQYNGRRGGTLEYDERYGTYRIIIYIVVFNTSDEEQEERLEFEFYPKVLMYAYPQFIGRPEQNVLFSAQRSTMSFFSKENLNVGIISKSISLAQIIACREGIETVKLASNTDTKSMISYVKIPYSFKWAKHFNLWKFLSQFGGILLTITAIFYLYSYFTKKAVVQAYDGGVYHGFDTTGMVLSLWFTTYCLYVMRNFLRSAPVPIERNIKPLPLRSTCVTDVSRLDLKLNEGTRAAEWKFRDPDWDIRGLTGEQASHKLGCSHEGKVLAMQIGPIFHGSTHRTPTVKHSCKQCVMAAAIRATSNKISADKKVLERWRQFFLRDAFEIRKTIDEMGGLKVSIEEWANTYPVKYREEIYRSLNQPHRKESGFQTYQSFPKTELQYTTVDHNDKDTILNDVKERQISAPDMDKKIAAGSFTKAMETVMASYGRGYGGPDNFEKISASATDANERTPEPLWKEVDFKGWDMTLDKRVQETLTDGVEIIVVDNNSIVWDVALNPDSVVQAYRDSETMKVEVARGAVQYTAEGRASGDSWTTFGNTWINSTFWRFILEEYGFNPYADGVRPGYKPFYLKCKGDDVIICISRCDNELFEMATRRYIAERNEKVTFGLGVVIKEFKSGNLGQISFLSNRFFQRSDGTYRMVRIPSRVFESMPWTTKVVPTNRRWMDLVPQLAYSKGECLLSWGRGLPIFDKLARLYMSVGSRPDVGTETDYNPYTDAIRVWDQDSGRDDRDAFNQWLFDMYGITESEVLELENIIDCAGTWDIISHPVIEKFFQ